MTAVEDFLKENRGKYKFFHIEIEYGLGVLLKADGFIGSVVFEKYRLRKVLSNRWRGFTQK